MFASLFLRAVNQCRFVPVMSALPGTECSAEIQTRVINAIVIDTFEKGVMCGVVRGRCRVLNWAGYQLHVTSCDDSFLIDL